MTKTSTLTPAGAETTRLECYGGNVHALAVLPDGLLASGHADGVIRIWDPIDGVETGRLQGHEGSVEALAVLPDGRLASGSWDYSIRFWDVFTGAETDRLSGHTEPINSLAMLPNGYLVSASGTSHVHSKKDKSIRAWNVADGIEAARFEWTQIYEML